MSAKENIENIQSEIRKTSSQPVKLVAVTKNRNFDEIRELLKAGVTDIGESRLQEAGEKLSHLPDSITKHFIGHLQTNKVKDVVRLFDVIQSVDGLKLARKIDQESGKIGKIMPILIQVNTSNEPQKGGVTPDTAIDLIKEAAKLPNIKIQGLMTIAIHSNDEGKVRACFKKLKQLFNKINAKSEMKNAKLKSLSMGMSEDYLIAVEEGANMVRIGRKIFE